MSAYVVDKATIDDITSAALHYGLLDLDTTTLAGRMLWDSNRAAVDHRYSENYSNRHGDHDYRFDATPAHVGQWARSVANYVYQCCGHPAWPTFEARELCVRIAVAMLAEIPGYHEADAR